MFSGNAEVDAEDLPKLDGQIVVLQAEAARIAIDSAKALSVVDLDLLEDRAWMKRIIHTKQGKRTITSHGRSGRKTS